MHKQQHEFGQWLYRRKHIFQEKLRNIMTIVLRCKREKINKGYLIFLGVRSIFISPNGHQKLYCIFRSGKATSINATFDVHE